MYLFLLLFCAVPWNVVQANLDIIFDDAECVSADDEYFEHDSCQLELNDDSEYGTSLSTHLEIIKQLPDDIIAIAKVYGIHMGEYTNDIGLHVETNFCEEVRESHTIAAPLIKAIGMTPDNCPPTPGVYGSDGFVITNEDGLPKSFPTGKYLLNIMLKNDETTFLHFDIYLTVV